MATASSFADRSARPTAQTTSAPRCCSSCWTGRRRTSSGTRSRLPRMADIRGTRASRAGYSATDWFRIDGSTHVPRDLLATSSREKSSTETMSPPRMKLFRRTFLRLAVGAAALPAVSRIARAQNYPARPIRLVVPFPPGGAYALVGRPLADKLKPLLGTMVIENIGGGGASLGASAVVRATADGYTVLLGGTQTHVNEAL